MTLVDLERRIQGLPNVFKYPLLSQARVKLRTSNLADTFTGSIRTKARYKFWKKGSVGVFMDAQHFKSNPCYPRNGKATEFKLAGTFTVSIGTKAH